MSNRIFSWLRRYIHTATGPWKAAVCLFAVFATLMALNAATILFGWHALSHRLVAYLALAGVGFFVSLLLHAYLSLTASKRRRAEKK